MGTASVNEVSPKGGMSDEDLAVRLRMALFRLSRRLERTRAGAALTSTETTVLSATARRGPVGISEIARSECMNPTLLSRVIGRLEREGLISRHQDASDRRSVNIVVTEAGRRLYDRIRTERSDALSALLAELPPGELAELRSGLSVLESLAERLKEGRQ
jgi:DNA-binding MarR family transcriptional regulator